MTHASFKIDNLFINSSISDEEMQDKAVPKGGISDIDVMGMCEQLIDLQLHLDQNGVPDAANTIEQAKQQIMDASRRAHRNTSVPSHLLCMDVFLNKRST
jgi:hypothetical protein